MNSHDPEWLEHIGAVVGAAPNVEQRARSAFEYLQGCKPEERPGDWHQFLRGFKAANEEATSGVVEGRQQTFPPADADEGKPTP